MKVVEKEKFSNRLETMSVFLPPSDGRRFSPIVIIPRLIHVKNVEYFK
jgi:hypothetical protein